MALEIYFFADLVQINTVRKKTANIFFFLKIATPHLGAGFVCVCGKKNLNFGGPFDSAWL